MCKWLSLAGSWRAVALVLGLSAGATSVAAQNWNTSPTNRIELGSMGSISLTAPVAWDRKQVITMIISSISPQSDYAYLAFEVKNLQHNPNDGMGRQHLNGNLTAVIVDEKKCNELNTVDSLFSFCFMLRTSQDIDIKDLRSKLDNANSTINELRKTIDGLSVELEKQIDALPDDTAADPKLVEILRTQLQTEFDKRYAKAQ